MKPRLSFGFWVTLVVFRGITAFVFRDCAYLSEERWGMGLLLVVLGVMVLRTDQGVQLTGSRMWLFKFQV